MERIIKKLLLSGCLVTAAAISFTALGSSSASAADPQADKTTTFSVSVPKSISLTDLGTTDITADAASIKTGDLSATVKSGSGFTISLPAVILFQLPVA